MGRYRRCRRTKTIDILTASIYEIAVPTPERGNKIPPILLLRLEFFSLPVRRSSILSPEIFRFFFLSVALKVEPILSSDSVLGTVGKVLFIQRDNYSFASVSVSAYLLLGISVSEFLAITGTCEPFTGCVSIEKPSLKKEDLP